MGKPAFDPAWSDEPDVRENEQDGDTHCQQQRELRAPVLRPSGKIDECHFRFAEQQAVHNAVSYQCEGSDHDDCQSESSGTHLSTPGSELLLVRVRSLPNRMGIGRRPCKFIVGRHMGVMGGQLPTCRSSLRRKPKRS